MVPRLRLWQWPRVGSRFLPGKLVIGRERGRRHPREDLAEALGSRVTLPQGVVTFHVAAAGEPFPGRHFRASTQARR